MIRKPIPTGELRFDVFTAWQRAFLLTCGDFQSGKYNSMTIGWGSFGIMWGKPFIQVVVRPTRYTYIFMEQYNTFTVSAFSKNNRAILDFLGTVSGRDRDKISDSGLTPISSSLVASPSFVEAELIFECKKVYFDDLEPAHFLAEYIPKAYRNDFHRIYFGEILGIFGIEEYFL